MGTIINHSRLAKVVKTTGSVPFSRDITTILKTGAWSEKRCLLIGGGPSLTNFDWSSIDGELTIGINKAFKSYPVTINYGMDLRFHDDVSYPQPNDPDSCTLRNAWNNFHGIKLFLKLDGAKFSSDVYTVNTIKSKTISFDLSAGIYPGANSGFGAMMLAIALGVGQIGLLGYDMKVDTDKKRTHFHEGYWYQKRGGDPNLNSMQSKLDKFKEEFEEFASEISRNGIEIVNLNQSSALECFRKSSLESFMS